MSRPAAVTLPAETLERLEELARQENRSVEEVIDIAVRRYESDRWWDEMNEFGRASAEAAGVSDDDQLVSAIHDLRSRSRGKPPAR